jgi:hypothetical protein
VSAGRQHAQGNCDTQAFPKGFREAVVKDMTFKTGILGARSARWCAVLGLALTAIGAGGCGSATVREGSGSSYLQLVRLEGGNGAFGASATLSTQPIASDILTFVKDCSCYTIFADPARITVRLAMRDVTNPNGPSDNNSITINRYRVEYRRSDGRNTPGVDVPQPYDSAVTATIAGDAVVQIPFEIVRINAKMETPLSALVASGGAIVISTVADVTFFGRDQTGREVTLTGSIGVNFSDWGDPQ